LSGCRCGATACGLTSPFPSFRNSRPDPRFYPLCAGKPAVLHSRRCWGPGSGGPLRGAEDRSRRRIACLYPIGFSLACRCPAAGAGVRQPICGVAARRRSTFGPCARPAALLRDCCGKQVLSGVASEHREEFARWLSVSLEPAAGCGRGHQPSRNHVQALDIRGSAAPELFHGIVAPRNHGSLARSASPCSIAMRLSQDLGAGCSSCSSSVALPQQRSFVTAALPVPHTCQLT
jgi:hypothetical protein